MAAGLSPRTVVRHLTVAHGVFKHAMRAHGLHRNPASAELVDRPTVRYSGEFVTFEADEVAALARHAHDELHAAATWPPPTPGSDRESCSRCAGATSTSPASASTSAVPGRRPRARRRRRSPARSGQRAAGPRADRPARPAHAPRALHRRGRPRVLQRRSASTSTAGTCGAATRPRSRPPACGRVRFHDLRHCFGSVAVRAFPLSDVQAMLGHAHITTTMRYVHHRPGADDAARLSSAFRGENVAPFVSPSEAIACGRTARKLTCHGSTSEHRAERAKARSDRRSHVARLRPLH